MSLNSKSKWGRINGVLIPPGVYELKETILETDTEKEIWEKLGIVEKIEMGICFLDKRPKL